MNNIELANISWAYLWNITETFILGLQKNLTLFMFLSLKKIFFPRVGTCFWSPVDVWRDA